MVDVAASIIGIIAAAGKVAETLGPMISVLRDVDKHTRTILSEVNASKATLSALNGYLEDLEALPAVRKDLIPLQDLVTTFTDGVLLFTELDELICRLKRTRGNVKRRFKTAWKNKELGTLSMRLQSFRISISAMLSILQWYVQSCLRKTGFADGS